MQYTYNSMLTLRMSSAIDQKLSNFKIIFFLRLGLLNLIEVIIVSIQHHQMLKQ